ncbi:hypothetical protein KBTX_01196 [wastewater metagenome]|uniref:Uncharacterized protein n=2 Tax=unclassified sequences TaxID=12908 RepID=A0A5B8R737_9ZZZZ|nr:hypothetical protein KBTEX_01196 [uncultured organism]
MPVDRSQTAGFHELVVIAGFPAYAGGTRHAFGPAALIVFDPVVPGDIDLALPHPFRRNELAVGQRRGAEGLGIDFLPVRLATGNEPDRRVAVAPRRAPLTRVRAGEPGVLEVSVRRVLRRTAVLVRVIQGHRAVALLLVNPDVVTEALVEGGGRTAVPAGGVRVVDPQGALDIVTGIQGVGMEVIAGVVRDIDAAVTVEHLELADGLDIGVVTGIAGRETVAASLNVYPASTAEIALLAVEIGHLPHSRALKAVLLATTIKDNTNLVRANRPRRQRYSGVISNGAIDIAEVFHPQGRQTRVPERPLAGIHDLAGQLHVAALDLDVPQLQAVGADVVDHRRRAGRIIALAHREGGIRTGTRVPRQPVARPEAVDRSPIVAVEIKVPLGDPALDGCVEVEIPG